MRKIKLLLVLLWALMPIVTWAADNGLETAFVGDKSYYVLRSADDWNKFRQLVADAGPGFVKRA